MNTNNTNLDTLPAEVKAFYQKAIEAYDRKNYNYSVELLEHVLKVRFDFAAARHLLHLCKLRAYETFPGAIPVRFLRIARSYLITAYSKILSLSGNTRELVGLLEYAYSLYPKNVSVLKILSGIFSGRELWETVIYILEECKQLSPEDTGNLKALGNAYFVNRKLGKARLNYLKVLDLKPGDPEAEKAIRDIDAARTIESGFGDQDID